jgi:hypothetical protein
VNNTSFIAIGFAVVGAVLLAVGTALVRSPRRKAEATNTGVGSFMRFTPGGLAYIAGWGLCLLGACVFVPVLVLTGANMGRLVGLALLAGGGWVLASMVLLVRRTRVAGESTPWFITGLLVIVGLLCALLGVSLLLPY